MSFLQDFRYRSGGTAGEAPVARVAGEPFLVDNGDESYCQAFWMITVIAADGATPDKVYRELDGPLDQESLKRLVRIRGTKEEKCSTAVCHHSSRII
jgi:hypothetical protein